MGKDIVIQDVLLFVCLFVHRAVVEETPQQSSNKPSQKNLEVSKLGTVLIPAPLAAPSVPGSVETAGYNVNSVRITR